ncbi:MAG: anhydro-N-acetylmuramic acid kinase [Pseudomonadota bacterium]
MLRAIGLMSGTSMDGIDVALLETDGENAVRAGAGATYPYTPSERQLIAAALHDAADLRERNERPGAVSAAESMITGAHAKAVERFLVEQRLTAAEIDLVGFHGQTVVHRPDERLTVQIGSGGDLARETGIRVVADMRAADVAAGGQGAPVVPVYHRAMARALNLPSAVFVNIGGVSNVTYVGDDGGLLAFDTGPGNALIDDWVACQSEAAVDYGGRIAAAGRGAFEPSTLGRMLSNPYFDVPPPKSLDRNHAWNPDLEGLTIEAGAALLTTFTAASIARSSEWFPGAPAEWLICGGGRHNAELMRLLKVHINGPVSAADEHGLDGDAIEAQAFAYLAVRALRSLPLTFPGTTGVPEPLTGGVIFEP